MHFSRIFWLHMWCRRQAFVQWHPTCFLTCIVEPCKGSWHWGTTFRSRSTNAIQIHVVNKVWHLLYSYALITSVKAYRYAHVRSSVQLLTHVEKIMTKRLQYRRHTLICCWARRKAVFFTGLWPRMFFCCCCCFNTYCGKSRFRKKDYTHKDYD